MKRLDISRKRYLAVFFVVMAANFGIGAYLLNTSFAQTADLTAQKTLSAEVLLEQGAPLSMSVDKVSNTEKDFQTIIYSAQNTNTKAVRAYVMLQKDSSGLGIAMTNYFYPAFAAGHSIKNSVSIERVNVKPDAKVYLFLDYVRFVDGTSWGADTERQSELIEGHLNGHGYAFSEIQQLLAENKDDVVGTLLTQEITSINPLTIDQTKSKLWQRGFVTGYRSTLSRLKRIFEKDGIRNVSKSMAGMRKFEELFGEREEK